MQKDLIWMQDSLFEERAGMFGKSLREIAALQQQLLQEAVRHSKPSRCNCCSIRRIC